VGTTAPTFSAAPYNSTSFVWETRTVAFTATETTHTIKFLPRDDDSNWDGVATVRMGIDCIRINPFSVFTTACDTLAGIEESFPENNFNVYLNPDQNILNVECKMSRCIVTELKVYDMMGRIVHEQVIGNSKSAIPIELSHGVFLVELRVIPQGGMRVATGEKVFMKKLVVE
jgi:hypothetical protein